MSNRITQEQKIQINELYAKIGIKTRVAKELGISVASVNKYLIKDYKPVKKPIGEFKGQPQGFNTKLFETSNVKNFVASLLTLDSNEWEDLKKLQEEIL